MEVLRVGVTRSLANTEGLIDVAGLGLGALDRADGVRVTLLPTWDPVLRPEHAADYDALLVEATAVPGASLARAERLKLIARYGAGYDSIDIEACADRGVLVTNAPDGVRRPMAVVNLTLILAATMQLLQKDRQTRAGQWDHCLDTLGMGLTGRTLALVGLGNIGSELLTLMRPLGMRCLAYDPYADAERAAALGAELVGLEAALAAADVVCITAALTPQTHRLIGRDQLALMKPTAFLVNAARGPIVDQAALTEALTARRIRGAALDVFEREPLPLDDPLLQLDNVVLSPHSLACTDECFRLIGESAARSILAVAAGQIPQFVVNRRALEHERWRAVLQ
jgi:D-3-phosphoglycerate dehydrogenase